MKKKAPLAITNKNNNRLALNYDLVSQLYADLREAQERCKHMESLSARKSQIIEDLINKLSSATAELEAQKAESAVLKEHHFRQNEENRNLNEQVKSLIQNTNTLLMQKTELEEKLEKIKGFHFYKVGQNVVEQKKKWGSLLGGAIGTWKYYRSCQNAPLIADSAPASPIQEVLLAKNLKDKDLNFRRPANKIIKIAAIMDNFTRQCYKYEGELIDLLPENWEMQITEFKPDILFIESAWEGKDQAWKLKVSNFSDELKELILYCRKKGIPSILWNKEDPVHFSTFLPLAKAVDFVFTTDMDRIPLYKKEVGHNRVYLLPFAAQPVLHNPVEKYDRKDMFCFAGSYYMRYPERQKDFASLSDIVIKLSNLDIYDRNFGNNNPNYLFPDKYGKYILGKLPYEEIDRAYKGYSFGINMNSIKQSQSMFARRVFELMASNTIVISNFSRGARNFFGDLVISSDNSEELEKRIAPFIHDKLLYKKHRLLSLRKVLSEHTYEARLEYIKNKIWNLKKRKPAKIAVMTKCDTEEEFRLVCNQFFQQLWPEKVLIVSGYKGFSHPEIIFSEGIEESREYIKESDAEFAAFFNPAHYYGKSYLIDLALAAKYNDSGAFGKASFYELENEKPVLKNDGKQYRENQPLLPDRCLVKKERLDELVECIKQGGKIEKGFAIDEFNFTARGSRETPWVLGDVLDPDIPNSGMNMEEDILSFTEQLQISGETSKKYDDVITLSAEKLSQIFKSSGRIKLSLEQDKLIIKSSLGASEHVYLGKEIYPREDLNLVENNVVDIHYDGAMDVRIAFIYLDQDKKKISHTIAKAGKSALIIPPECKFVQLRMRVIGSGEGKLTEVVCGQNQEEPEAVLCRNNVLVVGKNYPEYENLYKYGFVHTRVRTYAAQNNVFDIYCTQPQRLSYSEFENINVVTGDWLELEKTLMAGKIDLVVVHLIDRAIWNVLRKFLGKLKILIWIHGTEIQHWKRRDFNFELMDDDAIAKQKKRSDYYLKMWREILLEDNPDISYIFVSETLRKEAEEDLGMKFPDQNTHIIHNYIDSDFYSYKPKPATQRFKVLTIRSFQNKTYAVDLAVKTICELSKYPEFDKFTFTICGDGAHFEDFTAPVKNFPNVKLERGFLNRDSMLEKYRENGICLIPTRMDSQGVSRDEAMACGLVPITNRVSAVPEFVDESCGFLAEPEDVQGMVQALRTLAADERLFTEMSANAARKVRFLSGFDQTIKRELDLIKAKNLR